MCKRKKNIKYISIFMGEDCLLLLVRGLGSSGSLKWQSNLEHSTMQWVRLAALL